MNYAIIFLNFNNSYLPESRKKSSQELQRLALSSNSAGVDLFEFKQKKQSKVWNLLKVSKEDTRTSELSELNRFHNLS